MKHYFKLSLPTNAIDVFISALDKEKKTVTFLVVSKDGKVMPHPETNQRVMTMNYLLDKNWFTILGMIQVSLNYFDMIDQTLNNGREESKQNVM